MEEKLAKNKDPLFDMDDSLDDLSQVSDRYPVQMFLLKPNETLDSGGEQ